MSETEIPGGTVQQHAVSDMLTFRAKTDCNGNTTLTKGRLHEQMICCQMYCDEICLKMIMSMG
jgi:hypothetical protein